MAFNPHEPRALDGKWIKGLEHLNVAKKIAALPLGKKASHKGFPVRNLEGKGYRVRINNVGVNYKHPEDAARSMVAGKHVPAAKHIHELTQKQLAGNFNLKEHEKLKELKAVGGEAAAPSGESHLPKIGGQTPGPKGVKPKASSGKLPGQSEADWQKSILAKAKQQSESAKQPSSHWDKVLGDESVHGSAKWEYDKGLITKEELHQMRIEAMQAKIANMGGYEKAAKSTEGVKLMHGIQAEQKLKKDASGSHVPGESVPSLSEVMAGAKGPPKSMPQPKQAAPKQHFMLQMDKKEANHQYDIGLVTAEEFYARFGELPTNSNLSVKSLDMFEVDTAVHDMGLGTPGGKPKSILKQQNVGTAVKATDAAPKIKLKSGMPVSHLAQLNAKDAQAEFKAGSLSQTEFYAKFGKLPTGAYTSDPSTLDFGIINKLREQMGMPALKPPAGSVKTPSASAALKVYNPKELPSSAPPGAKIGLDAWNGLPKFHGSSYGRGGIKTYTGSGYGSMNEGLRKGLMDMGTASLVDKMDAAFKDAEPTPFDMVVHRGVSSHDSMFGGVGSHIGGVFIDHGFVSTSTRDETASSFGGSGAFIQIIVPKGTRVVNTNGISSHTSEKEIILNRGSKFEIVEDSYQDFSKWGSTNKKRVIVLRLVS